MIAVYPVLIKQIANEEFLVYIPDLDMYTQGKNDNDAVIMARDLLGTMSLDAPLPKPSTLKEAKEKVQEKDAAQDILDGQFVLVDIDTKAYAKDQ